jgi:hypothetical protein
MLVNWEANLSGLPGAVVNERYSGRHRIRAA